MLFFDDLPSNVRAARGLGIAAAQVPSDGMCRALLQRGLAGFGDRRRSQAFLGRWLAGPPPLPPPPLPVAGPMADDPKTPSGGSAAAVDPHPPQVADSPLGAAAATKRRRL